MSSTTTSLQTALLWVVAAYDMRQPTKDKDFYYDLGAVVVAVPVGLVAWGKYRVRNRVGKYDVIVLPEEWLRGVLVVGIVSIVTW